MKNNFYFHILLLTLIVYLTGAIGNADFDITNWIEGGRHAMAGLWGLIALVIGVNNFSK